MTDIERQSAGNPVDKFRMNQPTKSERQRISRRWLVPVAIGILGLSSLLITQEMKPVDLAPQGLYPTGTATLEVSTLTPTATGMPTPEATPTLTVLPQTKKVVIEPAPTLPPTPDKPTVTPPPPEPTPEPFNLQNFLELEPGNLVPMEMSFDLTDLDFEEAVISINFEGNLQMPPNQLGITDINEKLAMELLYQNQEQPEQDLGNFKPDAYNNLMLFLHSGDLGPNRLLKAEGLRRLIEQIGGEIRPVEEIGDRLSRFKGIEVEVNGQNFKIEAVQFIPKDEVEDVTGGDLPGAFTQIVAKLAERNTDFEPYLEPDNQAVILQFCGREKLAPGWYNPTATRYYILLAPVK